MTDILHSSEKLVLASVGRRAVPSICNCSYTQHPSFSGYRVCGSAERGGKANPVRLPTQNLAPLHQGRLRAGVSRLRRELVPRRPHAVRVLLPRHGRQRRVDRYGRENCRDRCVGGFTDQLLVQLEHDVAKPFGCQNLTNFVMILQRL